MTVPDDDLDRIMMVMAAAFDPAFGEAWTRRQVSDALVFGRCHYRLVDETGHDPAEQAEPTGFCLSRDGFEEEELLLIGVMPTWRGRGLGLAMLEALREAARGRGAQRLLLEMRRGNPAETLYRRFGFVPIGQRTNYYKSPGGERIDAITFACRID